MDLVVYITKSERTSPIWGRAFAKGMRSNNICLDDIFVGKPIALFGSQAKKSVLRKTQAIGQTWFYGDHAYWRRFKYFRCTRNAYQHDGSGNASSHRFGRLGVKIIPWTFHGRHIVVCPPDERHAQFMDFDHKQWLTNTLTSLKKYTDRPIKIRDRKQAYNRYNTLALDLNNAWAVVTHTSNVAVDAVIAGVPVFCTGQCAASAMGLSDLSRIEYPVRPEREQWAFNLADNQWTINEMERGLLWSAIGDKI